MQTTDRAITHRESLIRHAFKIKKGEPIDEIAIDQFLPLFDERTATSLIREIESCCIADLLQKTASEASRKGSIRYIAAPKEAKEGEYFNVKFEVANNSMFTWKTTDSRPIFFSYHWHHENQEIAEYDGERNAITKPINPGEIASHEYRIKPPSCPGRYILELTLVHEGVCWYEQFGFLTAKTIIEIKPKLDSSAELMLKRLTIVRNTYQAEK
jgi:hypothetical protein